MGGRVVWGCSAKNSGRSPKSRLNKGGIFAQWVNLFRMDASTLKSLFKAFFSVYPEGMVFANSGNIIMVGSADKVTVDHKRFNALLGEPVLKAKFGTNSIRDVNDVLWYFALSRDEAVEASKDAVPSRDANVLSEVRLSRLVESPTGDESPETFLEGISSMDVGSYLGPDVEAKLALLSMYFLREGAYQRADLAISQLSKINARTGRVLSHRRALEMLDFATATELYQRYSDWPSEAHLAQARAMITIGAYDEARTALKHADLTQDTRGQIERVDYLEAVPPRLSEQLSAESSEWLLMARADAGNSTAEELLVRRSADHPKLPNNTMIYVDRALVRHFAVRRDEHKLQTTSLALSKAIGEVGKELATIAEKALDANHPRFAAFATKQIELLNDTPEGLDKIKVRLSELGS